MKKWMYFVVLMILIAVDQSSKAIALHSLTPYEPIVIMPWLNLTLAYNSGAAFSFLNNAGAWHHWLFVSIAACVSVFLITRIVSSKLKLELWALSLILAGAVGNLIDRIAYAYVIDFIDVHYKHYHWPVFNIADSLICMGAALLILELCRASKTVL